MNFALTAHVPYSPRRRLDWTVQQYSKVFFRLPFLFFLTKFTRTRMHAYRTFGNRAD